MKKLSPLYLIGWLAAVPHAPAATITVNSEDNKNFHNGITNPVTAISLLHNGDTIAFNIPNTTTAASGDNNTSAVRALTHKQ